MIIISTDSEDEARDIAGVLSGTLPGGLPPDRDYLVSLNGQEYVTRDGTSRSERRDRMRELIRAAGPDGISTRTLARQLYREDRNVPSATLYRWLRMDAKAGLVQSARGKWAWTVIDWPRQ